MCLENPYDKDHNLFVFLYDGQYITHLIGIVRIFLFVVLLTLSFNLFLIHVGMQQLFKCWCHCFQDLRSRLEERFQQREKIILANHENEMKKLLGGPANKMASKVRCVMLKHKHMVEIEKFRFAHSANFTLNSVCSFC